MIIFPYISYLATHDQVEVLEQIYLSHYKFWFFVVLL
jgi:hypothetical protein